MNYLYFYGQTKGYKGIGFYVNKQLVGRVLEVKGITERIGILKLKLENKVNLMIMQIYAPTLEAEESEKEHPYELVRETYLREKKYYNILMGDWNAKIGAKNMVKG